MNALKATCRLLAVLFFGLPLALAMAETPSSFPNPEEQTRMEELLGPDPMPDFEMFTDEDLISNKLQLPPSPLDRVRVCLQKRRSSIRIKANDPIFYDPETDLILFRGQSSGYYTVKADGDWLRINGNLVQAKQVRVKSAMMHLQVDGRLYREDLLILRDPSDMNLLWLTNELHLERYLYGLINQEVLSSWPLEAKKAQAVAARSYASYRKQTRTTGLCDVEPTALDQMYGGMNAEDPDARQAVQETEGEVLTYNQQVAAAFYHSSCGGQTTSSESVWGKPFPYLKSITSPYGEKSPKDHWNAVFSVDTVMHRLEIPKAHGKRFFLIVTSRDESGRVKEVTLRYGTVSKTMTGNEFRKALGFTKLPSTRFSFKRQGDQYRFDGRGNGHGVGMCQWSAAGMAEQNFNYRQILQFFYPGTEIQRLY